MIYPGLKIGNFVMEDELGRGGFGSVYLAKEENSGRYVAVKFLHPKTLRSERAKQSFLDEMINQAKLSINPNIVQVERSISYKDRHGEHLGMVMEFVDGEPLDLYIHKYSLLPGFVAIPIFIQVLNGISFAHQSNMLHRDIKPGNILIGTDGLVKIMDFGLAKIIGTTTGASESARAASLNYVAPERLDKGKIDVRTDIYSLGATFYEALTGTPPYKIEYGEWEEARKLHKSSSFKSIREFYDDHSTELERFIEKSLAPEPSERYSSCIEMKNDLVSIWEKSKTPPGIRPEFDTITAITNEILKGSFTRTGPAVPSFKTRSAALEEEKKRKEEERKRLEEEEKKKKEEEEKRRKQEEERKKRETEELKKRQEEAKIKIDHLIQVGSYKEALELLKENFEISDEFAAQRLGKLEKWDKMSRDIECSIKEEKYDTAIDLLSTLSAEVPIGEGKQQLILKLNDLKEQRKKEIQVQMATLEETEDLTNKIKILDRLIKISPSEELAQLTTKKEKYVKEISKKRKTIVISILVASVLVFAMILFFTVFLPQANYRKNLKLIEAKLKTNPGDALVLIKKLQRKKDNEEIRRFKEKAEFNVRLKKAEKIIREAENLAASENFDSALSTFDRVKKEVFKGMALPQFVKNKEKEIREKASGFYLNKARNEPDNGNKFLYYDKAKRIGLSDSSISSEMEDFLEKNKRSILSSLLSKASSENDCKKAKYLINLCYNIDMTAPRVIPLREKIYNRCR